MAKPEANERRGTVIAVLVIAILVVAMFAEAFFALRVIGDRSRDWRYGSRAFIPAESYVSTEPAPPSQAPPKQVELPPPTIEKKTR